MKYENQETETTATTKALPISSVPECRYFAGWQCCDDTVSGGMGATIEDAVNEYLSEHAESEALDYGCLGDGDEITVEIYTTMNREEAAQRGMDEEWDEGWQFMLDKVVARRTYEISITDGAATFIPQNK